MFRLEPEPEAADLRLRQHALAPPLLATGTGDKPTRVVAVEEPALDPEVEHLADEREDSVGTHRRRPAWPPSRPASLRDRVDELHYVAPLHVLRPERPPRRYHFGARTCGVPCSPVRFFTACRST